MKALVVVSSILVKGWIKSRRMSVFISVCKMAMEPGVIAAGLHHSSNPVFSFTCSLTEHPIHALKHAL